MEKYPLHELVKIKKKRFEQAVKLLEEKKKLLEKEKKILIEVQEERDKVFKHKEAKLNQLRNALDEGEGAIKITQKKNYLKLVKEKLLEKENKVEKQKKSVEEALSEVEKARKNLLEKQKDIEKLKLHRKSWDSEMRVVEAQKDQDVQDEVGSIKHIMKKREKK